MSRYEGRSRAALPSETTNRLLCGAIGALIAIGLLWILFGHRLREAPPAPPPAGDSTNSAGPQTGEGSPDLDPPEIESAATEASLLDLGVTLIAPSVVVVGTPFRVTLRAENTGGLTLSDVTLSCRGFSESIRQPAGATEAEQTTEIRKLLSQQVETHSVAYVITRAGPVRIVASAREARGWAAGGARIEVTAVEPKEDPSDVLAHGTTFDMRVEGEVLDDIVPGRPFRVRFVLENTGDLPLQGVSFAWTGRGRVGRVQGEPKERLATKLAPGERSEATVRFQWNEVDNPDDTYTAVNASARDAKGWAAAGVYIAVRRQAKPTK